MEAWEALLKELDVCVESGPIQLLGMGMGYGGDAYGHGQGRGHPVRVEGRQGKVIARHRFSLSVRGGHAGPPGAKTEQGDEKKQKQA